MITIVVSSFRYGHLAAHCLETIMGQSIKPTKVLFVDDGVGDCSFLPKIYPNVQYTFRENNLGTAKNFQDMLMKVDTEYCMFLGADNWLRSDTICLMTNLIKNEAPDIITYDLLVTGSEKNKKLKKIDSMCIPFQGDFIWDRKNKHHGSILYRTELAKKVGGYQKVLRGKNKDKQLEDLKLYTKMIATSPKVIHIAMPLLFYRHHVENFNK